MKHWRIYAALACFLAGFVCVWLTGCSTPNAQKGGSLKDDKSGMELTQGENPAQPTTQTTEEEIHREYFPPAKANTGYQPTNATVFSEHITRKTSTSLGASQKDEARSLGAKFSAMKPVQWTGIALCAGSIAAFWWGWPTLGFIAIGVGAGMITFAAIIPGHETAILIVGAVGLIVTALVVLYAYSKGKLDANGNGTPDFLEKT